MYVRTFIDIRIRNNDKNGYSDNIYCANQIIYYVHTTVCIIIVGEIGYGLPYTAHSY